MLEGADPDGSSQTITMRESMKIIPRRTVCTQAYLCYAYTRIYSIVPSEYRCIHEDSRTSAHLLRIPARRFLTGAYSYFILFY